MEGYPPQLAGLATFRKFIDRLPTSWPEFLEQRRSRLAQQERNGIAAEKVAENILEDFFTIALDWKLENLNNQLHYADLVLTNQSIKRLLVEVKRPGSLRWDQPQLESALVQAWRYADEQRVRTIAVSDGTLFYAADIVNGGLQDRARLMLDRLPHSPNAWWLSQDGIYRPAVILKPLEAAILEVPERVSADLEVEIPSPKLLHPKYKVPAECFAYVGDASKPTTWKLPYRLITGAVDEKHLPGAIRSVVSNYRGERVKTIPEAAVPDVLVRLGIAAAEIRKLPGQCAAPLTTYRQLRDALYQLDRLDEVLNVGLDA